MINEAVAYIHGVSPRGQGSHQAQYQQLHDALTDRIAKFPKSFCGVEWGWNPGGPATSHQLLSDAEEELGYRATKAVGSADDFTLNPLRLVMGKFRELMI